MTDEEPDAGDHPMAEQYGMDVDMLLSMGVEPIDAIRFVRKCMHHAAAITLQEAYGRGGLTEEARKSSLNIKGLRSLDFACQKDDGSHWDFPNRLIDKKHCDFLKPTIPIGSSALLHAQPFHSSMSV